MYTFFSFVFGLIWAVASFLLLFKVWDVLGPIVLGISKNHIVQAAALVITYIVIFGVPAWCWVKLFGVTPDGKGPSLAFAPALPLGSGGRFSTGFSRRRRERGAIFII